MEKGQILLSLIELIVLMLPIGSLIWKASAQSRIIKELELKQIETNKRVDKLEERNDKAIDEIKLSLNSLNVSFAEIKTALTFITESIKKEDK